MFKESGRVFKLIRSFFERHRNFILYGIFGLTAALIDYGVFTIFAAAVGLAPEAASIIGNVCGFIFTFFTNTFLNFKKKDHFIRRFLLYFFICACGWGISTLLIHCFKDLLNQYILKMAVMVIVTLFQYLMNKFITYRK